MVRNPEKTFGALIDKCSIAQLCYMDKDGFPVTRAMLASPTLTTASSKSASRKYASTPTSSQRTIPWRRSERMSWLRELAVTK